MALRSIGSRIGALAPMVRVLPKQAERFYTSAPWRALVASIKRERGAFCQRCGAGGRIIGDHVIERKDGGADLDAANVELLCTPCHARKTARARAQRALGG